MAGQVLTEVKTSDHVVACKWDQHNMVFKETTPNKTPNWSSAVCTEGGSRCMTADSLNSLIATKMYGYIKQTLKVLDMY